MNNKIERDVIKNSEYIIHYFYNEGKKEVTNLMLEKLLYFLEAIYMSLTDEDYLYVNQEFYVWDFGPVDKKIYNKYKIFGRMPIKLDKNIIINEENKKYIEVLYKLFKDFSTFDLVNLSHSKESPWYKINKKYNGNLSEEKNIIIEKEATKEWFSSIIESSVKNQNN